MPIRRPIDAIRKANLRALVGHGYGASRDFAEAVGFSRSYLAQLLSPGGAFGARAADRIERALDMPEGWLDFPCDPERCHRQIEGWCRDCEQDLTEEE